MKTVAGMNESNLVPELLQGLVGVIRRANGAEGGMNHHNVPSLGVDIRS